VKIVVLHKQLCSNSKEYVLSKQLLRSGTGIGANVAEAQRGQSKPDFISKMNIALKEANESEYWLRLLHKTGYIAEHDFQELKSDVDSIIHILAAIGKTATSNIKC
jgi:four helix bundle protein